MHDNVYKAPWWVGPLALLLVLVGTGASVAVVGMLLPEKVELRQYVPQPQEDEPGWDCHTMGNRICGR